MTSLYESIGVDPSASDAEVKAAYRKAAKKAHPDAGGSAEQFKAVGYAGMILCDPAKRAHYDKTGEERGPVNEVERRIASMLLQAFEQDDKDPIRIMCDFIDRSRSQARADKAKFVQLAKKMAIKLKKFIEANKSSTNKQSRDFIVSVLEHKVAETNRMAAAAENEVEICSACLAYLNDLKCPAEGRSTVRSSPFGLGGTVTWSSGGFAG